MNVARVGLCAVKRRFDSSGCEARPVTGRSNWKHLERFKEETTWTEALLGYGSESESASMQAITRVNAEQASKSAMREPTWQTDGEGRRGPSNERQSSAGPAGLVAMACVHGESTGNTGSPGDGTMAFPTGHPRGTGRAAEEWRTGSQ
jgi:hypothetical protein